MATRTETDSMGSVEVPVDALWRAQTERARQNFQLSSLRFPARFIHALAQVKAAAAKANAKAGVLTQPQAQAIIAAADTILAQAEPDSFPLDIFQTGSGTSTNMNMNEVLSSLVKQQSGLELHPNDHINASQSSNDVIPTTILVSSTLAISQQLLPALQHLQQVIKQKATSLKDVVKTGRTHLMDAMPLTFAQELSAWAAQVNHTQVTLEQHLQLLQQLPQGGTAIGSGVNAPDGFAADFCQALNERSAAQFCPAANLFAGIAGQEVNAMVSGTLNAIGTVLLKISNDLRWMNSGPLAGLGEISLTALQPGSSIMPGKVNPVIPEAVAMVAVQVAGNYHTVSAAAQQGNFQLNVMLPVIAYNQLQSIELLSHAARALADQAIADFSVNHQRINAVLARNPILVTALNREIGYNQAAAIAKQAYQQQRDILDVAAEQTDLDRDTLARLLDPKRLTE
ncbi:MULTISPECIES: class II fumarate hydratase [Pseudidiomarina]|uniref:fumarate hydratase n=2 Tax=Pseudidiomarina TaxID=2800384 RepID=A0A368V6M1_9GAMM|nr:MULTISPECIES: class II fumarate hydratase [Pseudidiomarina]PWW16015.1 fumarase class II [Pseudidiomarina maritima]RBP93475.1 fumarase class II [Pseudidiomarina tainanensis]RCW35935.1 fumarase class II [Pseudidiomarina tainanensis]